MKQIISLYPKVSDPTSTETIPLDIFLENIRSGIYEDLIHKTRLIKDKKRRQDYKRNNLPSVTISGVFLPREDDKIKTHSSYLAIDIDEEGLPPVSPDATTYLNAEEFKSIVVTDQHVAAAFVSASGNGLCILFRINGKKHREAFQGVSEYLYRIYGAIADPSGINPSRARFVSYDPHLYIADHPVIKFAEYPKAKEKKKFDDVIYSGDDFSEILNQITIGQINITQDSYFVWLRLGFALVHKFGEAGRDYFHLISQYSGKYDAKGTDRQFDNCYRHKSSHKVITISTFYYYAKAAGVKIYSDRTERIAQATSQGKRSGLNAADIVKNLDKFEGITGTDVADIVQQAMTVRIPDTNVNDDIKMFIRQNYSLRRNDITRYIENFGKPISKVQLNTIYIRVNDVFPKVSFEKVQRIIESEFVPDFNPFIDFFNEHNAPGLDPADHPNIRKLFASLKTADDDFTYYFGLRWLIGAISAVHGEHSPLFFVIVGAINKGKTEWFRRMLPKSLKKYYAESKLDAGKDDSILMCQKWFIMDDEMSGKSKRESITINHLTSQQIFSLREPYGHGNVDLMRLAILCGTTNYPEILTNPDENRRFIPVFATDIDHALYNTIDHDELIMEAYRLWASGFDWRLKAADIARLHASTEMFHSVTAEAELIQLYFEPGTTHNLTATDIKVYIEKNSQQRLTLTRLGIDLKRLGFEKKHITSGKSTRRVYGVNYVSHQPAIDPAKPRNLPF